VSGFRDVPPLPIAFWKRGTLAALICVLRRLRSWRR
jgi:hypothetical protein